MDELPVQFTDPWVKNAPKENLYAFFGNLGNSPAAELSEDTGLVRWHTRVLHPWFNGILSTRPPGEDEGPTIREAADYFRARGVRAFTWWLSPGDGTAEWGEKLRTHGFSYDNGTPGMAIDLAKVAPLSLPAGLKFELVRTPEALKTWVDTFGRGYGLPDEVAEGFYHLVVDLGYEQPMRNYTGFIDGRPVSTSTLFLGVGVAGIYNVATLPEARGKGLGTALTVLPLLEAREMGYHTGVLQSSDMGYPVYQKIGFRTTCLIDHYYQALKPGV